MKETWNFQKFPEGSALQRCRFKCDNLAFLPKDMAGNVSSEHCYLGCLWFSELGCTPLPPAVPHINQPLLDMVPPPPPKPTGGTGSTGSTVELVELAQQEVVNKRKVQ